MIKSAHAGKIVQEGTLMAFDEMTEGGFITLAHALHEGNVFRFRWNGLKHGGPLLAQWRKKKRLLQDTQGWEMNLDWISSVNIDILIQTKTG